MGAAHSARFCVNVAGFPFVSQIPCIHQIDSLLPASRMQLPLHLFLQQWLFRGGVWGQVWGTSRAVQHVLGTAEFCLSSPQFSSPVLALSLTTPGPLAPLRSLALRFSILEMRWMRMISKGPCDSEHFAFLESLLHLRNTGSRPGGQPKRQK